jgi:sarcosine oxidase
LPRRWDAGTHVVDGVIASAQTHGLQSEVLDASAMRRRFPAFVSRMTKLVCTNRTPGFSTPTRVWVPYSMGQRSGCDDPARRRRDLVACGRRRRGGGDSGRRIRAGRLVLAAGPWSSAVLADLGLPLQAVRQYVTHFEPDDPARFTAPACPAFIRDVPEGEVYGIPYIPGHGLEVGGHDPGQPVYAGDGEPYGDRSGGRDGTCDL